MDINALRVFNSLYNLKISETEFKDIEEEQKHTERTGLSIKYVRKERFIAVSHDENHKIIIREHKGDIALKTNSRVLFKTLITFEDLPQEIYSLHQIAQYRALDKDIKFKADNLEEIKDRICDRFSDDYPKELGEGFNDIDSEYSERQKNKKLRPVKVDEQLKALYWLFDEEYKFKDIYSRINVPRIIKVFQRKNRRIALIKTEESWDRGYGFNQKQHIERTIYKIKTFKPTNPQYNYVCPNREFSYMEDRGEVWLDDDLFEKVCSDELYIINNQRTEEGWLLLNANKYDKIKREIKLSLLREQRAEEEKEGKEILEKNIEKQFKKGKVTRCGITFTKNSFSYEGITIKGTDMDKHLVGHNIIILEQPNFNNIFNDYIEYLLEIRVDYDYYPSTRTMSFLKGNKEIEVNNIKITIQKEKNRCYSVNGFRITKEDLEEVIKKSINFIGQKTYDEYLQQTSRVCLKLQKAIDRGFITFKMIIDETSDIELPKLNMPFNDDTEIKLSLPIRRKDNKNYLIINKKEYPVKNIVSLICLINGKQTIRRTSNYEGYLQRTISQLFKSLKDITPKEIGFIIQEGVKEHKRYLEEKAKLEKETTKRSKEFLEHSIKITKSIKVRGGYIVKGLSGMYYFIDKEGSAWTTKNKKQDEYLCLIDLNEEEQAKGQAGINDTIARRLIMLSKDKKVAKEIWDSGDKMDKIWENLQEVA